MREVDRAEWEQETLVQDVEARLKFQTRMAADPLSYVSLTRSAFGSSIRR